VVEVVVTATRVVVVVDVSSVASDVVVVSAGSVVVVVVTSDVVEVELVSGTGSVVVVVVVDDVVTAAVVAVDSESEQAAATRTNAIRATEERVLI
jgi:hypothetical protein